MGVEHLYWRFLAIGCVYVHMSVLGTCVSLYGVYIVTLTVYGCSVCLLGAT